MSKITVEKVYKDLDRYAKKQNKLHRAMREDFEFALGKQWKEDDKSTLERAGVTPLTINQIKPMIKIITGIERQSRSDYVAFPEGQEDELTSEIVTKLLKNVVKRSRLDKKTSEQFKEGMMGGLCFIEPYIDYTYDLINGEMRFRKISADRIFFGDGEEYDLSDRPSLIKITRCLSKDDLLELFPDGEKKIESVQEKTIDFKDIGGMVDRIQTRDYEFNRDKEVSGGDKDKDEYDLIEYYYKKPVDVYYVADKVTGQVEEYKTQDEADQAIAQAGFQQPVIIRRKVPEIRLKQVVGDVEFDDDVAWCFPRWKFYPIVPFIAEWMNVDIEDTTLLIQGITRSLKDQQIELNKSRTLELRHLNSTSNSGWMPPKGALDPKTVASLKRFGSTPGWYGEYDPEKTGGVVSPETFRIRPAQMPQGHMALSAERREEIKQSSGINADLLANDSQSQSGRAILLKQRQGLVMIHEALDNYSDTKKILGRFILSQLGEVYTVESALKVIGEAFLTENFSRPVLNEDGSPAVDDKGQLVEQVDQKEVMLVFNKILNDSSLGKYDVSIGEGAYNETVRFTNYMTLMEMVEKGIPIPPEVLIQESLLNEGQKKKIVQAIESRMEVPNGK